MKWKNISCGTTFFITATITEWQPLLNCQQARDIVLGDLAFYRKKYGCKILAYVIMPEHYHLVLQLCEPNDLHGWLHDFQMHTSNELCKLLRAKASPKEMAVYAKHANGNSELAIWKEQARALGIVSERVLCTKIEYIHKNPVTRGLVSEPSQWPWPSWRNYYLDDDRVFQVDKVEML